ncbi:MAG: hypothetical protein Q8O37_13655 [Sulfuricellaceae bacterium]|nr:hypothetical protein [Sulfuricellaceae bacterium]
MPGNLLNQLRDNPRLRWGIALIIGIFWLYAILLLRESLQEHTQQQQTAAQAISRLRAQLAQPEWIERVLPAKTMAVQLEGKLWQAPTAGLAQAAFQDWLNAALLKVGAGNPQITVTVLDEAIASTPDQNQDASTGTPADLWKIKAKLGFGFSAASLMGFLSSIEDNQRQIIVNTLNVRKEPHSHVEMELYGYFQKQAAPTKPLAPQ